LITGGKMKVKLTEIKNTQARREDGDIKELAKSIQEVGLICPLTLNQNYKLLAGRRRFKAISELGWEEVECNILNSENELFDFRVAIEENLIRKPLTDIEMATAIKEYDELKRKLYGSARRGERTDLTSPQYGEVWTQKRTAEDLNISQQAVSTAIQIAGAVEEHPEWAKKTGRQILHILKDEREGLDIHNYIRPYNLWSFAEPLAGFGKEYPGRMPAQIVINLLWYFTDEGDLVVDPMAGGGTTIDVCKIMNRKVMAYDIQPIREDIKKWDITQGFPDECSNAQLILLDPPYWQQKKGKYSADESNLANLSLDEFYVKIEALFVDAQKILAPQGYLAFIIGSTIKNIGREDHALKCYNIASQYFNLIYRIIVPYPTQQYTGFDIVRVKENKQILNLYRDLMIFQKKT